MRRVGAAVLVAILGCVGGARTALAQTLYSVSRDDDQLRTLDPATGLTLSSRTLQCDPDLTPTGCPLGGWGLAAAPVGGLLWVVTETPDGQLSRRLSTFDPCDANPVLTDRGNLGGRFAALAFNSDGKLYGVTDQVGALVAGDTRLFGDLETCTGAACNPVELAVLTPSGFGQAIAFDTPSPALYHAGGPSPLVFEVFPSISMPGTVVDIGSAGHASYTQSSAMTLWQDQGVFLITGQQALFEIDHAGVMTPVNLSVDHVVNGLAFSIFGCGPEGTPCTAPSDCQSLFCVDDKCCDDACGASNPDDCQACSIATGASAEGTCTALSGTTCDDADACTQIDTCNAGACAGANPVTCVPIDDCHDAGTCDPGDGLCSTPAKPDGDACDDSDACTQLDTCQTGACVGASPTTCTASDECHDAGICDSVSGVCSDPAKPDGSVCSQGTCQAGTCTPDGTGGDGGSDPSGGGGAGAQGGAGAESAAGGGGAAEAPNDGCSCELPARRSSRAELVLLAAALVACRRRPRNTSWAGRGCSRRSRPPAS